MNLSLRNKVETYLDILTMSHSLLIWQNGLSCDRGHEIPPFVFQLLSHDLCDQPVYHCKRTCGMIEMSGYVSNLFLRYKFIYILDYNDCNNVYMPFVCAQ